MKEWEDLTFAEKVAIKDASERSFLNFTRLWFEILQGEKMLVNWHHKWIASTVDSVVRGDYPSKNLAICIPPGGTKTELMSIHLPAYTNMLVQIEKLDKFRNLNLSFADSLVKRNSRRTRDIINSREYQEFWPCEFGVNQAEEWQIVDSKGKVKGETVSRAMGGQITGGRGGYYGSKFSGSINLDDALKPEDCFSQTKREAHHRKLTNTIRSRRGDKSKEHPTPFFIIQQRLHKDDTIGFCTAGNLGVDFELVSIPALITEDYLSTLPPDIAALCWQSIKDSDCREINGVKYWSYWPEMEHIDQLIELWERDEYTFMSQYMQAPITMSGGLIDTSWFGRYIDLPWLEWMAIYADTNSGKVNDRNDYTVFTLCGMGQDENLYVLESSRGKWTPSELLEHAKELWDRWRDIAPQEQRLTLRQVNIEDKQAGQGLIVDLEKQRRDIMVNPVQRGTDQNKLIRHNNCQPQIKAGRVFLPMTVSDDGEKISHTRFFNGDDAFSTDWVLPFITELDAITAGILMDQERGYDDQYDTLMDAIDDILINGNPYDGWL